MHDPYVFNNSDCLSFQVSNKSPERVDGATDAKQAVVGAGVGIDTYEKGA